MDLELLLRRKPVWREIARGILFSEGDIVEHGEEAEKTPEMYRSQPEDREMRDAAEQEEEMNRNRNGLRPTPDRRYVAPKGGGLVLPAAIVALLLGGCGHSSAAASAQRTSRSVCIPAAVEAIAQFLSVRRSAIATARSIGNDEMPQCTYRIHLPHATRVEVTANVDTSPSPYAVLERTIEEAAQGFGPPPPVHIPRLGVDASWFPEEQWLKTTDGVRLVTTSVDWKSARQAQKIALATRVTRPYLKMPHRSLKCGQTLYVCR